jgi:hypothetical protein
VSSSGLNDQSVFFFVLLNDKLIKEELNLFVWFGVFWSAWVLRGSRRRGGWGSGRGVGSRREV